MENSNSFEMIELSAQEIAQLHKFMGANFTVEEVRFFGHICKKVRLDPYAKQIFAIKRGLSMTIQTAIDGFRLLAERSGKYAPGEDTQFLFNKDNNLIGAKVFVKKLTADGSWHSISATAFLAEYSTGKALWVKMPSVMIEKCAEARALRRAFPADLSGLYAEEEMDQANNTDKDKDKIDDEKVAKINKFLEGKDDIRAAVLKLCAVKRVEDIREPQLDACTKFVKKRIKEAVDKLESQRPKPEEVTCAS